MNFNREFWQVFQQTATTINWKMCALTDTHNTTLPSTRERERKKGYLHFISISFSFSWLCTPKIYWFDKFYKNEFAIQSMQFAGVFKTMMMMMMTAPCTNIAKHIGFAIWQWVSTFIKNSYEFFRSVFVVIEFSSLTTKHDCENCTVPPAQHQPYHTHLRFISIYRWLSFTMTLIFVFVFFISFISRTSNVIPFNWNINYFDFHIEAIILE